MVAADGGPPDAKKSNDGKRREGCSFTGARIDTLSVGALNTRLLGGNLMLRDTLLAGVAAAAVAGAGASAAPSVTLSSTSDHPSSQVNVSGAGFEAGKGIDLFWDTSDEMLVISNSAGAFSAKSIPVPADATPGTHWVTALERDNGNGAQTAFTVNTNWFERGFGPQGRRYNPYENVISPSNAASLDVAWTHRTGDQVSSSQRLSMASYMWDRPTAICMR